MVKDFVMALTTNTKEVNSCQIGATAEVQVEARMQKALICMKKKAAKCHTTNI